MVCLLMTRPVAASQRFWQALPEALRAQLTLIVSPLLEIQPVPFDVDYQEYRAVIFTSAHGVDQAGQVPGSMPAYCVGERTTAAARAQGWDAQYMGQTADALVAALPGQGVDGPVLHLHGRHTRMNVSAALSQNGLSCRGITVYDQHLLPLSEAAQTSLSTGKRHIVPLFSPRTAQQFAYECNTATNIFFIAMSEAVAEPLKSLDYMELQVSQAPDADAMAKLVSIAADRLA